MKVLFALVLLAGTALAQDRIVVQMAGAPEFVVTPRAVVAITGHRWSDESLMAWPDGETLLGGYFVQVDGQRCPILQVNSEALVFLVPEAVREGNRRTLWIQGPRFVRFLDVRIEKFWPHLNEQDGNAVAFAGLSPVDFIGTPIPVSPSGFNYVSLLVTGFLTGRHSEFGPALTLQREGERYEIAAEVYDVPGFAGTQRLAFWAPPCANGEYRVSARLDGYQSNSAAIRFTSTCPVVRIERYQFNPRTSKSKVRVPSL